MLQAIKDRASGWIAYAIVILISIPFALWGVNQYFGGGDPQVVATVNGDEIPLQAFNTRLQQQRQRLAQQNDGVLPSGVNEAALKAGVIQGLVLSRLIAQESREAGYEVGDQLLFERITEIPAFQSGGRFSPELYTQMLAAQRLDEQVFEQNLREEIRQSQFVEGVEQTAFVTPSQRQDYARLKHQQRDLAWFVIPADFEAIRAEIDDEAVARYYEAQKAQFRTPERVKLAYVKLDRQALAERIEVDEQALRAHYRAQLERYTEPEQRRARHILIQVPQGASEDTVAQARAQAEKVAAKLAEGGDFAQLAEEFSDDTLSATQGGDLGFIARGDMSESFEQVLFSLKEGKVSEPVRTELGFQIIKLEAIKPAKRQSFAAVREQVAQDYRERLAERRMAEQIETLLTVSYEQPDSLEPTADALGADVRTTGWFTAESGEGIAGDVAVRKAAFSDEVLLRGRNSELIQLSDGGVAVVRVIEHEPAKPQSLDVVRDDIVTILAVQKARERARAAGEAALASLREGQPLQAVAEEHNSEVKTPGFVGRDSRAVPGPILIEAFAVGQPVERDAVYGGAQLPTGYAVLAVQAVRPGDETEAGASGVEAQQVIDYGARELQAVFDDLEAEAEVKIMEENL